MNDRSEPLAMAARSVVILNCLACLAFGVASWLVPTRVAKLVDISLNSPTALADLRAMYGGLCLAIAALLWRGLRDPSWFAPSLYLTAAMCAGLATGRIYSSIVDGVPNTLLLTALATEIISLVWALFAYRGLRSRNQALGLPAASA